MPTKSVVKRLMLCFTALMFLGLLLVSSAVFSQQPALAKSEPALPAGQDTPQPGGGKIQPAAGASNPGPKVPVTSQFPSGNAPQGPQLRIKTSGAAGVPAQFQAPKGVDRSNAKPIRQSPKDWSVDFEDGFESGIGSLWQVYDESDDGKERTWGSDDWAWNSGAKSVWVASGGVNAVDPEFFYYPHNLDSWLITNGYFDLTSVQMADVEFYMWYETEPQYDYVFVGASTDGLNFYGQYWTGLSGDWQYFDLDLSEYIGSPQVYIGFYFHSDGDNTGAIGYEGAWLDDVKVWTYVDTPPPAGTEEIQNGDFETGDLSGWSIPQGSTVIVAAAENPIGGNYVAYFGGIPNADEMFYQPIDLPDSEVSQATLAYWVNQFGDETNPGADLFCAGIYSVDMSSLLVDLGCSDGTTSETTGFDPDYWGYVDFPLTAEEWNTVRGQTVNIAFEMYTNDSLNTTVFIDDVTFEIVTGGSAGDFAEPNNFYDEATPLTPGIPIKDLTIDPDGDYDYFSLNGTAGDLVTVDIDAAVNNTGLDSYVWLLDPDGHIVCENDDDGFTTDSYLQCTLAKSGTHYVVVTSYDGRGDRNSVYSLLVLLTPGGDPSPTPPPTPVPTPTQPAPPTQRSWTAMLYINGDNDLCADYPGLITRMENRLGSRIGPNGFLNVVVLLDRDPNYCNGDARTTRYVVQPNGSYTDGVNRWEMGELNMGDPQTLINFVKFAMASYPADHYYLAIDDHGNGLGGISWDFSDGRDNLTNPELFAALKEATENGSKKLDLFAYEACLMGMYENVYDLRSFTQYIFGFPTISYTSDTYPSYLSHPSFTASSTGLEFGQLMLDTYFDLVNEPLVTSLADTSKLDDLQAAVNAWADAVRGQLGAQKAAITTAYTQVQRVDTSNDNRLTLDDKYVDLWDLSAKLAAQGIAANQASALQNAISAAVIRAKFRSRDALNYDNSHGLTIYWPQTASGSYSSYVGGEIYNATRAGTWDEFLQAYFGTGGRGVMPVDPGPVERIPPQTTRLFLPVLSK